VRKDFQAEIAQGNYDCFFSRATYETTLLLPKQETSLAELLPRLQILLHLLASADFTTKDTIKNAILSYAEEVGKGAVLWPLRVALSGQAQSPDPFTIAHCIGPEETLARLAIACDKIMRNGSS